MKTCICDFCETKTADRRYKATKKYLTFPWGATQKVDICDDCYIALFVKKEAKKTEPQPAKDSSGRPVPPPIPMPERYHKEAEDSGWILVKERSPEWGQLVLAAVSQKDPLVTHSVILTDYKGEGYWNDGNIIAWMPAPINPYIKEEGTP